MKGVKEEDAGAKQGRSRTHEMIMDYPTNRSDKI